MFDWLMARAIVSELGEALLGGRIQQVLSVGPLEIGFEIYAHQKRRYLIASAAPEAPRVHLVEAKLRASPEPLPTFVQQVHKYAEGALVNRISQPPYERIIELELDHHDEGISTLVVELMGRRSNLIFLDAGREILDAAKRVPSDRSRVRPILPRLPYRPPPPQNKLAADRVLPAQFTAWAAEDPGASLAELIVRHVAGLSPMAAREAVFRSTGATDTRPDPNLYGSVLRALQQLVFSEADPTVGQEGEEIAAAAAYALTHFSAYRRVGSASAALEAYYGAWESYLPVKEPLRRALEEARDRIQGKRASLRAQMVAPEEIERLKTDGEWILGYSYGIERGQLELRAEVGEGEVRVIALDPQRTAVENAQAYFRRYQAARDAAAEVPARLRAVENELAFVDQLLADVEIAETRAEIDAAQVEAEAAGLFRIARPRTPSGNRVAGPREFRSADGFTILVGRNARQNDALTLHRAGRDDLWLHVRGAGGSHVIVLTGGREVPEGTVLQAAALAAYYSQARAETQADVIVTARKNVRPVRHGPPGLVTVRSERVVRVQPRAAV